MGDQGRVTSRAAWKNAARCRVTGKGYDEVIVYGDLDTWPGRDAVDRLDGTKTELCAMPMPIELKIVAALFGWLRWQENAADVSPIRFMGVVCKDGKVYGTTSDTVIATVESALKEFAESLMDNPLRVLVSLHEGRRYYTASLA